ncbi:MAG: glycine--tRNA ligase subunit alpha [Theionarchaea archaeon]|nr:glycine--tRNA ligase subunit alpha [Theionarchaea archaeon]
MDDYRRIREEARKDFEKTWKKESEKVQGRGNFTFSGKKGRRHLLSFYVMEAEDILLNMGFSEVQVSPIWDESHVRKQYGPEAPAILDRLYYLATLPRPDIAISQDIQETIQDRTSVSMDDLQTIFRDYKRGVIDSGELIETFVQRLSISTEDALFILSLFPQLEHLIPEATSKTLISHFTTAWFPTLAAIHEEPPVCLYTSGWRFRREQREDASHLRAHYNLSFVVMGDIQIEDGKDMVKEFFSRLGMDVTFTLKENQPSYYAYNTNYEVFYRGMEVADMGMFSPVALANYHIPYPVFNVGPGLGRIIMLKEGIEDIRQVHFPEFYGKQYADEEICDSLYIIKEAHNQSLVKALVETAHHYKDEPSPCSVPVYDGDHYRITLIEKEENTRLIGPAAFNELYVYEGSIYGVPASSKKKSIQTILEKGVPSHLSYLEAFAQAVVHAIEEGERGEFRIGMVNRLSDINVDIPTHIREYIRSQGKIDVRGPMFTTVSITEC